MAKPVEAHLGEACTVEHFGDACAQQLGTRSWHEKLQATHQAASAQAHWAFSLDCILEFSFPSKVWLSELSDRCGAACLDVKFGQRFQKLGEGQS